MTPFSFYKIALLGRKQTVAENPGLRWTPFGSTEPMGYAYEQPGFDADRFLLSHVQPAPNSRICLIYDQHGLFSDPELSVLYIPREHTQPRALVAYVRDKGLTPTRTIAFVEVESETRYYMMIFPGAMMHTKRPWVDCSDEVQTTHEPIDWSSILRAAGKPT
ncbi:hypothetical protein DFH05DRAFT_1005558 [Lentinula detonsa]|uniref:Uncharacterized protein n=1 Tax=Lentinula detonsa TaxID=2804962 RepID=A0A9W8P1T3_9AGAR|nr:hypothetical protein DFH05DRAFT_1005558 [Lentinula detonsa]